MTNCCWRLFPSQLIIKLNNNTKGISENEKNSIPCQFIFSYRHFLRCKITNNHGCCNFHQHLNEQLSIHRGIPEKKNNSVIRFISSAILVKNWSSDVEKATFRRKEQFSETYNQKAGGMVPEMYHGTCSTEVPWKVTIWVNTMTNGWAFGKWK